MEYPKQQEEIHTGSGKPPGLSTWTPPAQYKARQERLKMRTSIQREMSVSETIKGKWLLLTTNQVDYLPKSLNHICWVLDTLYVRGLMLPCSPYSAGRSQRWWMGQVSGAPVRFRVSDSKRLRIAMKGLGYLILDKMHLLKRER